MTLLCGHGLVWTRTIGEIIDVAPCADTCEALGEAVRDHGVVVLRTVAKCRGIARIQVSLLNGGFQVSTCC
jgi:hypothetical protein